MDTTALRSRFPLFLAVFIDIFSFGLMYPLIVGLFNGDWIVHAYSPAARNTLLSLAFSLFPLGMFFGASLLGDLSDALGRRRTLMICMIGLAGAYALMWTALELTHIWLFFAGRLLSGLMAGTAPIAQACVIDTAAPDRRSAAMAHIILANTFGMIAGPAVGGLLGHWDFRLPLALALVLCLVTVFALRAATFTGDGTRRAFRLDWMQPFRLLARVKDRPAVAAPFAAFFLFQFGFLIYYTIILIEMQRSYGFTTAQLGLFSMALGIGCAISSAWGYGFVRERLGNDRAVTLTGLALCGLFTMASALPVPALGQVAIAVLCTMSNILAYVTLLAAISSAVDDTERGWALGIGNAGVALSVLLAGLLTGLLTVLTPDVLLAAGGLLILAGIVPALRVSPGTAQATA